MLADSGSPQPNHNFRKISKPLSHVLSRFWLQLLSIQRFWSGSPANFLISKDQRGRGIYQVYHSVNGVLSSESGNAVSFIRQGFTSTCLLLLFAFRQLSSLCSRFCLQLLSIQRFWWCSPAMLMIPKDHVGAGISLAALRNRTCHA